MKIPNGYKKAKYGGVPIYFNEETSDIIPRNFICNILFECVTFFAINIIGVEGFLIEVEKDKPK